MAARSNTRQKQLRFAAKSLDEPASQFTYRRTNRAVDQSGTIMTEDTARASPRGDSPFRHAEEHTASARDAPISTAPDPTTRRRSAQYTAAVQANTPFRYDGQEKKAVDAPQDTTPSQHTAHDTPLPQYSDAPRRASPYRYIDQSANHLEPLARKSIPRADQVPDKLGGQLADIPKRNPGSIRKSAPSQPRHIIGNAASTALHRRMDDEQDDNVGVQASNELSRAGESALQTGEHIYYTRQAKRYRTSAKAGKQNKGTSNPVSRLWQRRAMRKRYAAMHREKNIATVAAQSQTVLRGAETTRKAGSFVTRHRRGVVLALLALLLVFVANSVSACTPLIQTVLNSIVIGTYPASEEDVLAAEQAYRAMEISLQDELDHYTQYHPEYDEAVIDQQSIWHDPYVLMALISAGIGDSWTAESAQPFMERLFARQYEVTERIETQTRYRTERGPNGAEVQVPYTYTICYVTMVNNDLSHLPFHVLSYDQVCMYALYMATLGNMPDLFAGNPHSSKLTKPMTYDVPEELLEADPAFAQLIEEAEKYIGYPYVWGGYNPDTSFDCSGFISYVFTNSGVYDIGRRSATGLHEMCQPITPEEARPGDLIFFEGTLGADVGGVTHVGLYVGNNRMIHCGNPISYADLTESYWQQHFFSYGRVPY